MFSPGDTLLPGEDEVEGLKKRLDLRLGMADGASDGTGWEIGECLSQWWRPNFETFMVQYFSLHFSEYHL
jgi:cleavage and polyadenylation specificity factor subunit 5